MMKQLKIKCVFVSFFLLFTNSYSIDEDFYNTDVEVEEIYDPFESVNREIWKFNLFLLKYVAKPINGGYVFITTQGIRSGVSNMMKNLNMPFVFSNYALQLEGKNALISFCSFVINSTFGVLGFFDIAKANVQKTDFGITMGKYGVPSGPYLMAPVFGPMNVRGAVSKILTAFLDPFGYNMGTPLFDDWISYTRMGLSALDEIHFVVDYYDLLEKSFDSYILIKDSYVQLENFKIKK